MLANQRTLMSRFITSGSEHMFRRYWEMPIGNTFPIYLRSRTIAQIPTLLSLKRLKSFGHLSNLLKRRFSLRENGILKTDSKEKANICNRQFRSAITREDDCDPALKGASLFSSMGDITVDPKGVAKLFDGLNVHKASGPDGLNARVLKECSNEISLILALIYNESLAWGDVPDEWRQANVSPVFKKGEKYDAASYRLVSLTYICSKTLEHILVSNINKHLLTVRMVSEVRSLAKPSWSILCTTSSATCMGLWIVSTNRQFYHNGFC